MLVEWDKAPVVVNVFVIAEKLVSAIVEYLHVESSFVESERVVEVVSTGIVPEGEPEERTGGLVSVPPK